MRTVHVEEPDSGHTMLWLAAGAILGLAAGVMLADRIKGRRGSLKSLVTEVMESVRPLLGGAEDDDLDDAEDDELDDEEELDADAEADAIDARVLEAFANDPILMQRDVEIEERDPGVIILHGTVRAAREVKHAVTIARGVPGVERVRTRLTVRERPR